MSLIRKRINARNFKAGQYCLRVAAAFDRAMWCEFRHRWQKRTRPSKFD